MAHPRQRTSSTGHGTWPTCQTRRVEYALLGGLEETQRRAVLAAARRRKFAKREVIFHEGDAGDTLHLVDAGHVGLRITTPMGDIAFVRVVKPGDFFGELALLSPGARSASAIALEGAQTLSIHRADFEALHRSNRTVADVLVTALVMEVRRLAAAHVEALYLPAEKRLFRRLVEVARAYSAEPPVSLPIIQDEVAQLAGTTRPTANRLLREAQEAGALTLTRGRIEVHDYAWIEKRSR
jgi:CRP/FNR family transcriptional regulator, cyclic AMP receptor protein